jgi:putative NIF3 family GTP cyclohydrolase 1 type 2
MIVPQAKGETMPISSDELVAIALELGEMERLPGDSAVQVAGENMQRLMFGIDIAAGELLLARQLGMDGVIAHHPCGGFATLHFPEVLTRQIELLVEHGVPAEAARDAAQPLISRAMMSAHASNFDHVPSVARLLGMPLCNIHLPLDELGRRIMVTTIDEHLTTLDRAPLVQDAIDALQTLPELADAQTRIMVPVGAIDNPLGKLAVIHGAGTNGGARIAQTLFDHGIGSVLYIHCAADEVARLRESSAGTGGNLIVTGHIASDMIGINRYVAAIEARGVEVVRMSGL